MKSKALTLVASIMLAICVLTTLLLRAQENPAHRPSGGSIQHYEYAIAKWDGSDRIQVFYPDKFDSFRVFWEGNVLPRNAHEEEYCVNVAINKLAKDGWEPIQLHATRVLFRRAIAR